MTMSDQQTPLNNNKKLQIVNEHKQFTQDLNHFLQSASNQTQALDPYDVVAVFGSQSTGKSTLLNKLFQTEFDVMQSDGRRQQTTHGIWLSISQSATTSSTLHNGETNEDSLQHQVELQKNRKILVLDVEGTDGRERGEDQEFERKSALFSMAIAEVLIVNMWENAVGLYNGANLGLLKTVFEVNLQLFSTQPQIDSAPQLSQQGVNGDGLGRKKKTCLLFVIRDCIDVSKLRGLQTVLEESLQSIWDGLMKHDGSSDNQKIGDYFDLEFVALPHKLLQPDQFNEEAQKLSDRFNVGQMFKPEYSRNVPLDGFPRYAQSVWETVISNKDLDLPSQQQLLAQYRCDEIMTVEFQRFQVERLQSVQYQIDSGVVVEQFGQLARWRNESLQRFDTTASRYHAEVFGRKHAEMQQKMNSQLHVLFVGQMRNLRRRAVQDFKVAITDLVKVGDVDRFGARLVEAQTASIEYFRKMAEDAVLAGTDWSTQEDKKLFEEELQEQSSKIRAEEMEKQAKRVIRQCHSVIVDSVLEQFADCPADLWQQVASMFDQCTSQKLQQFDLRVQGLAASDQQLIDHRQWIMEELWDVLRTKLKEELSDQLLPVRLRQHFERLFKYNDVDGLPRVWQQNEQIEPVYVTARDRTEQLVLLLAQMPVPEEWLQHSWLTNDPDFDEAAGRLVLLSPARQRTLRQRFRSDADMIFLEVKRGAVSTFAEVPRGVWLLLFLLGFNELYAAVTFMVQSPLLLVLICALGGGVWLLWQSGLLVPVMRTGYAAIWPAIAAFTASLGPFAEQLQLSVAQYLRQVSEQLDKPLVAPINGPPSVIDEDRQGGHTPEAAAFDTSITAPSTPVRKPQRFQVADDNKFFTPMKRSTVSSVNSSSIED